MRERQRETDAAREIEIWREPKTQRGRQRRRQIHKQIQRETWRARKSDTDAERDS